MDKWWIVSVSFAGVFLLADYLLDKQLVLLKRKPVPRKQKVMAFLFCFLLPWVFLAKESEVILFEKSIHHEMAFDFIFGFFFLPMIIFCVQSFEFGLWHKRIERVPEEIYKAYSSYIEINFFHGWFFRNVDALLERFYGCFKREKI